MPHGYCRHWFLFFSVDSLSHPKALTPSIITQPIKPPSRHHSHGKLAKTATEPPRKFASLFAAIRRDSQPPPPPIRPRSSALSFQPTHAANPQLDRRKPKPTSTRYFNSTFRSNHNYLRQTTTTITLRTIKSSKSTYPRPIF